MRTGTGNRPSASSIAALARRAGLDGFILALLMMILLAWLWPSVGDSHSVLHLSQIANAGVSIIFFFYGLRLSVEKLAAGLQQWRLHLVVQATTFIMFPLLILGAEWLLYSESNRDLWLAIFFLSALPSTVSSSVVMVSIAGGNLPAAIFNASISSLLGVFITPLWMGLFLSSGSERPDLGAVFGKLLLQVIMPVIAGILLHAKWGAFAEKHRNTLRYFDQSIILLIVYTSFCESFTSKIFSGFSLLDLGLLAGGMTGLFFFVYALVHLICRSLDFNRENRITALFCGSKKSLIHGTVMARLLFPGAEIIGIILLPLMIYHAFQLIFASVLAQKMSAEVAAGES